MCTGAAEPSVRPRKEEPAAFAVQLGLRLSLRLSVFIVRATSFPFICHGKLIYGAGRKLHCMPMMKALAPVSFPLFRSTCRNRTAAGNGRIALTWRSSADVSGLRGDVNPRPPRLRRAQGSAPTPRPSPGRNEVPAGGWSRCT